MTKTIELIEWEDSMSSAAGWQELDREWECAIARSVGEVVFEDDTRVTIAGHVIDAGPAWDRQAQGVMTIPKSAIRRRVRLVEEPKERMHPSDVAIAEDA